jgi:pyrroloquinoline quinone biosynthesis protein D
MNSSFVPKLASKARLRFDRHSGGHMLIYPERGLQLNESAAEILKRCDGTKTVGEITKELALASGVEESTIEKDIVDLLTDLSKKGLLEL